MDNAKLKKIVAEKLNEGLSLGQIQDILNSEYHHNMTFLDLRLLASELENIDWSSDEQTEPEPDEPSPADADLMADKNASSTVIEISKLVRPGAVMSGSVRFASGAKAEWLLDRMGRLSLDKQQGEPTEDDLAEFQKELQNKLSRGA